MLARAAEATTTPRTATSAVAALVFMTLLSLDPFYNGAMRFR
jgi:hypothetical protein